jgi:Na+-driven multidrug efflux pump
VGLFLLSTSTVLPSIFTNEELVFTLFLKDVSFLIFYFNRKIIQEGTYLVRMLALIHLLDGTQSFNGGILRAVGAQFYASIAMFIGFCVIGTSVALGLLLKTNLRVYGK